MSDITEEEIARAIHKGLYEAGRQIAPGFPGDYLNPSNKFSEQGIAYVRLMHQARAVLALLQPALERARREERERCAVIAEDHDGLPCRSLLTGQRQEDYDCGQIDASTSIAAAIRKS